MILQAKSAFLDKIAECVLFGNVFEKNGGLKTW